MATPRHFKVANFGDEPEDIGAYCVATIDWCEPVEWEGDTNAAIGAADCNDALYVIIRDHWKQAKRSTIAYVGMTTGLPARFDNHPCADEIRKKRGTTMLSVGKVTYSGKNSRWARENPALALRQIEHLLIWALWPTLVNKQSIYALPLLSGKNIAHAKPWIVRRDGHRLRGRMPREIVYPWMIVKPGRDRSARVQGTS